MFYNNYDGSIRPLSGAHVDKDDDWATAPPKLWCKFTNFKKQETVNKARHLSWLFSFSNKQNDMETNLGFVDQRPDPQQKHSKS